MAVTCNKTELTEVSALQRRQQAARQWDTHWMLFVPPSRAGDCLFDALPAWCCSCWHLEGAGCQTSDLSDLAAGSDL